MGEQESFGGGDRRTNEVALEHVTRLIVELQPGSIVESFVVVVATADVDDRWMSVFVSPGQKRWETLGLLAHATLLDSNVVFDGLADDQGGDGDG